MLAITGLTAEVLGIANTSAASAFSAKCFVPSQEEPREFDPKASRRQVVCWSGQASAAIALGGLFSAYYLKKTGNQKEIYLPTAYFVLMEGLQAVTYIVVDDCSSPWNVLFTRLAILHISCQPIFINMLGMEFIQPEVKARIKKWVYIIAGLTAVACAARLLPIYDVVGRCTLNTPMCSHIQTCAYSGEWHIGWNVLLNGFNEGWAWYLFTGFLLPVLYGSWKWSAYHLVVGPGLASLTTSDINERPAVWCLFSTCIIALLVNTRLRNYVYVKEWFTWDYLLVFGRRHGYAMVAVSCMLLMLFGNTLSAFMMYMRALV